MGKIIYNSHLSKYFIIDSIYGVSDIKICGTVCFDNLPSFMIAEVLAQLASFHTKYCIDFEKHTYLLKIQKHDCFEIEALNGEFQIEGVLAGKSDSAYSYELTARNDNKTFMTKLIIGIDSSGTNFSNDLNKRNKRLFECLKVD